MTICPNCGSDQEDDSIFCEECGFQITSEKKSEVPSSTKNSEPNPPEKKKIRFVNKRR